MSLIRKVTALCFGSARNRRQFGKLAQFVFSIQQRRQVQRAGFVGNDLKFSSVENQFVDDKPAQKKIPQAYAENQLACVQQRRRRETRIVGDANLRGDKAKLAEPMNLQTVEIDVLAEDFLQFLLHLIAIFDREDVESLHECDRRNHKRRRRAWQEFFAGFSSRKRWRARSKTLGEQRVTFGRRNGLKTAAPAYDSASLCGIQSGSAHSVVDSFDDRRDALADADAHGGETVAAAALFHFMDQASS